MWLSKQTNEGNDVNLHLENIYLDELQGDRLLLYDRIKVLPSFAIAKRDPHICLRVVAACQKEMYSSGTGTFLGHDKAGEALFSFKVLGVFLPGQTHNTSL